MDKEQTKEIFLIRFRKLILKKYKYNYIFYSSINVSRSVFNAWWYGRAMPNPFSLKEIALELGVSTDYLLGISNNKE